MEGVQGTCETAETLCRFEGIGARISWESVLRSYCVLKGINDTKSLLAIVLVRVFIALILTLVSACPAGS